MRENCGSVQLIPGPRDVERLIDVVSEEDDDDDDGIWTIRDYIDYVLLVTKDPTSNSISPSSFSKKARKLIKQNNNNKPPLLYGKDVPTPSEWNSFVTSHMLPCLAYKRNGDILGSVPSDLSIETKMCYVGYHGTQTPAHTDLCSTMGHNLMVSTSTPSTSCLWFLARSQDLNVVREYLRNRCNVESFNDSFFIPIKDALKEAPFPVFVADQREGDLVLVPPRGWHQAINRGPGITCKFAWSRLSPSMLLRAIDTVVPVYRSLARPETYRLKLSAFHALLESTKFINSNLNLVDFNSNPNSNPSNEENEKKRELKRLETDLPILIHFIEQIYRDERFSGQVERNNEPCRFTRICDLCQCDIFNRCFHSSGKAANFEIASSVKLENEKKRKNKSKKKLIKKEQDGDEEEEEIDIDICLDCAIENSSDQSRSILFHDMTQVRQLHFTVRENLDRHADLLKSIVQAKMALESLKCEQKRSKEEIEKEIESQVGKMLESKIEIGWKYIQQQEQYQTHSQQLAASKKKN